MGRLDLNGSESLDKRIESEIEARLQEIDLERTKWVRILNMMRGGEKPEKRRAEVPVLAFGPSASGARLSFTEVVLEALTPMRQSKENFNLAKVVKAVRKLPLPEAQDMSRQQVRNAFRKVVVRRESPLEFVRKGLGNSGDFYRWK